MWFTLMCCYQLDYCFTNYVESNYWRKAFIDLETIYIHVYLHNHLHEISSGIFHNVKNVSESINPLLHGRWF